MNKKRINKKLLIVLVISSLILSIAGCKDNNLSKKAVDQGKLAMAEQEYSKALSSFQLAVDEGLDDEEVIIMINIIKDYNEAKKLKNEEQFDEAEKILSSIDLDYKKYAIREDINALEEEISNLKEELEAENSEEEVLEEEENKKEDEISEKENVEETSERKNILSIEEARQILINRDPSFVADGLGKIEYLPDGGYAYRDQYVLENYYVFAPISYYEYEDVDGNIVLDENMTDVNLCIHKKTGEYKVYAPEIGFID